MSQFYGQQQPGYDPNNLQFYSSSYGQPVSGHSTPAQAQAQYGQPAQSYGAYGAPTGFISTQGFGQGSGFGGPNVGVSGRMGEQGGLRMGWLAAFGTEGYDGEPPLLEELGVNFGHIKGKTFTVLNPMARIDQHIMDDSDLFGPIIFCLLFGTFLLLAGKVHFGYIYGLAAIGSVSLHQIFSLMSNPQLDTMNPNTPPSYNPHMSSQSEQDNAQGPSTLTFFRSCSVLGYCLLPLVLTSFVGVVLPMDTLIGYLLTMAAVTWCTFSSSGMFCAVGRMSSMRPLVAYPLMLFYVGFGIMGIFSSRGSAGLGVKA